MSVGTSWPIVASFSLKKPVVRGSFLGTQTSIAHARFVVFGFLCHSWLPAVVPRWLAGLKVQRETDKPQRETTKLTAVGESKPNPSDLDPALAAEQEWAKITGKRASKTESFASSLVDTPLGLQLTALSIIDEPIRLLTFEFLKYNDSALASATATLVELANPRRSPLIAATQYLSSLLFADRGRLILLSKKDPSGSWIRLFRRLCLLALAWVQRRHCDRFHQFPFSLCLLADDKASETCKRALAQQWDSTLGCCLRPGMARSLKARGISGEDLMGEKLLV